MRGSSTPSWRRPGSISSSRPRGTIYAISWGLQLLLLRPLRRYRGCPLRSRAGLRQGSARLDLYVGNTMKSTSTKTVAFGFPMLPSRLGHQVILQLDSRPHPQVGTQSPAHWRRVRIHANRHGAFFDLDRRQPRISRSVAGSRAIAGKEVASRAPSAPRSFGAGGRRDAGCNSRARSRHHHAGTRVGGRVAKKKSASCISSTAW